MEVVVDGGCGSSASLLRLWTLVESWWTRLTHFSEPWGPEMGLRLR